MAKAGPRGVTENEAAAWGNGVGNAEPWTLYSPAQRWFFLGILFLTATSNYIDRQVISILIEPIKLEFGASDTTMGLLSGFAFALVYAVVGIPVAWLADRGDRRIILSVSLFLWSVMTVLCGMAQNLAQLVAARIGVGVGEAGANAPAQSLIADYFPPGQRARALSVFAAAAMVGYVIAFIAGAHLADTHGWRTAFIVLGLPGVILPLLCFFGLREPRHGRTRGSGPASGEPIATSLRVLASKRSYVLLVAGMSLYFFVSYGAVIWFPSYMVRLLGAKLTDVAGIYGAASAAAALVGTIGGGIISDKLAVRNVRWLAWMPAIALIVIWPIYVAALLTPSVWGFIALAAIGNLGLEGVLPALYAVIHRVCGSPRRAMAVAISLFCANLIGLGAGPPVAGLISDRLGGIEGAVGLRHALMLVTAMLLPAGILVWASARHILGNSES